MIRCVGQVSLDGWSIHWILSEDRYRHQPRYAPAQQLLIVSIHLSFLYMTAGNWIFSHDFLTRLITYELADKTNSIS